MSMLPPSLLTRASLVGGEYAWPIELIPSVIEGARKANLVSIGCQLQFRLPVGGVCECYWIELDTYRSVDKNLPWKERVQRTAEAALRDFTALENRFDFIAEGHKAFERYLDDLIAHGHNPEDSMYFVWDVLSEADAVAKGL